MSALSSLRIPLSFSVATTAATLAALGRDRPAEVLGPDRGDSIGCGVKSESLPVPRGAVSISVHGDGELIEDDKAVGGPRPGVGAAMGRTCKCPPVRIRTPRVHSFSGATGLYSESASKQKRTSAVSPDGYEAVRAKCRLYTEICSEDAVRNRAHNNLVEVAAMAEAQNAVHVQMRFPQGGVVLDYRVASAIAVRMASELIRHGVDVRIDDFVTDALPDLPNADLWSP